MAAWGLPEVCLGDIVWVVSELVENSVRHTPTEQVWVDLRLSADRVQVEVFDQGAGLPPLPQELAAPEHRHGLDMIRNAGASISSGQRGDRHGVTATWALPTAFDG